MFKKNVLHAFFISIVFCLQMAWAGVGDVKYSIGVMVTPAGQKTISRNIPTILFNNGLSVDEFFISDQKLEFEEYDIREFGNTEEMKDLFERSKSLLEKYLMGFELNNHLFEIDLKNIFLQMKWDKFALSVQNASFEELSSEEGVLLVLDVEAPNVKINIDQIRLRDLNNDFLGEFGVDKLFTEIVEGSVPFTLSLPIHLTLDDQGHFKFKVKTPFTNFDQLDLEADFGSPLVLPNFEVSINGKTFGLNQDNVEKDVRNNRKTITNEIKVKIQNFVDEKMSDFLTEVFNERFSHSTLEVNEMDAPGAESPTAAKYKWGLRFSELGVDEGHLLVALDGFVSDPSNQRVPEMPLKLTATKFPDYKKFKNGDFDAALSINQGFMNRILQLSYHRGYYKKVDVEGEDEPLILSKQPSIRVKAKPNGGQLQLKLQLEHTVKGFSSVFVKNPIRVDFAMDLKMSKAENGKTQLQVQGIDMSSVYLDKKYIRMFGGKVRKSVREKFENIKGIDGMVLLDEFPVPESIMGIPLAIKDTAIDSNGHMILLLDFNFEEK